MDYQQLIDTMTPDIYQRLQRALELGKWPDGRVLTPEQRETTMQAIIVCGEKNLDPTERVGFIDKKQKEGDTCDTPSATPSAMPLNWKD